ncbi:Glycosyltransferase involved in cell wall bisynthesis [Kosakonia radicincitans]|uniref:glycosyltransferase n=1 Tax=Kosakonia radicincitans TaxID=283686 RepID=UPI0009A6E0D8|nr:glycosyltransferase [Kosakonia radicincitans]SKC12578.1 Glycosyltransferase involved in cell wall bisynthesis [Kosakonia radicincitans]
MISLAYIDPYAVPDTRVASLQILQNVDAFARHDMQVFVVTPTSHITAESLLGRSVSESVVFSPLSDPRGKWYFPFNTQKIFFLMVRRWLKHNPVDVIYTRNLKMARFLLSQKLGIPVIFESHEIFAQSFKESHNLSNPKNQRKYQILRENERFVYQNAAAIVVLTSFLEEDIRHHYSIDTTCIVSPDGVDSVAANEALSTTSRSPSSPASIFYLGSLHPWKGIPTAISAMRHVTGAKLTIAGGNAEQIATLSALAQQEGVTDKINFLGYVNPRQRFLEIAHHDICILPLTKTSIASRYTSPLKLFEYMAMGKAIVIADLPSIREVVDESCVFFAESENSNALGHVLQSVIDNSNEARKRANAALALAKTFTWDHRAQQISQTVHHLLLQN